MHAIRLLHKFLKKAGVIKHEKRLTSLLSSIGGLLNGAKLSLTSIGRHMGGPAKVKHKIKSSYNLLTNGKLHAERFDIYAALSESLLYGKFKIDILVDWSPCIHHDNQILKASVVLRGKTMTLYEEVHPEAKLGNYEIHKLFLKKLKLIVPGNIKVTVMTDAGFRTEWFNLVKKMGWDFTGRVRSNMCYQRIGEDLWTACAEEHPLATNTPVYRGEVLLSKENELPCYMYLYKGLKDKSTPKGFNLLLASIPGALEPDRMPKDKPILIKNNHKYFIYGKPEGKQWKFTELGPHIIDKMGLSFPKENTIETMHYHKAHKKLYDHIASKKGHVSIKKKKSSGVDKKHQKSANDPWLIVSSHGPAPAHRNYDNISNTKEQKDVALTIIKQYAKRMKIEHEFRSTKSPQYGIGLSYSRSMDPNSLQMLLLIGQLHLFLLWLIGLATEYDKKQYDYQANTVKTHRVLSLVFLGMQVILHDIERITEDMLMNALAWGRTDDQ